MRLKYMLICLLAAVLCMAVGWGLSCLLVRLPAFRSAKKGIAAAAIGLLLMAAVSFGYLENYYHADDEAAACLAGGESVHVAQVDGVFFFDGPGTERAIVFFPGARVEETAYAPLLFELAERGTDCFLLSPPFHMAIFDASAPDELIAMYDYDSWYLMGHSLGGIMAARYAALHSEETDGVILLAAYADRELAPTAGLLSIYGSRDCVLNREIYEQNKQYWPEHSRELIIEGGSHAGFGCYGAQRGDGQAAISAAEQQARTVEAIVSFLDTAS